MKEIMPGFVSTAEVKLHAASRSARPLFRQKDPKALALGVVWGMACDARRIQRRHNSLHSDSATLILDSVPRLRHAEWANQIVD